jgi:hypothetical protein
VEELSRAIVNKLLHGPTAALRGAERGGGAEPPDAAAALASMAAVERMFELGPVSRGPRPPARAAAAAAGGGGAARGGGGGGA